MSAEGTQRRRAVLAAVAGNVLEWYDFAVYAYMATLLARKFFPSSDEMTSLLSAFATFGVGFVLRPLGAVVIGRLGDRRGRKAALTLTIALMAAGTLLIGLAPTYDSAGLWAPALVVTARLLQGFSAGGEWGTATAFLVEWAPPGRRGLYGSLQQCSVAGGLLLGAVTAALVSTLMNAQDVEAWGWRIPFLLGALIGPVGWYMRRHIEETPSYRRQSLPAGTEHPAVGQDQAMADHRAAAQPHPGLAPQMMRAFGFTVLWTVSYYIVLSYLPTFLQQQVGLSRTQALWSTALSLLLVMLASPLFGHLSDRIGRRPLLLTACVAFVVTPYLLLSFMLADRGLGAVIACQSLLALAVACFSGPGPAAIAEMFPTRSRTTGMSIGYSLAVALFGGFAPFIATWLIARTGNPVAPAWYVVAAASITLFVVWRMKEASGGDLR